MRKVQFTAGLDKEKRKKEGAKMEISDGRG